MNPETLTLLQDPLTGGPLEPLEEPIEDGQARQRLTPREGDRWYRVDQGIPVFIDSRGLAGANRKYPALYDRVALWSEIADWPVGRDMR